MRAQAQAPRVQTRITTTLLTAVIPISQIHRLVSLFGLRALQLELGLLSSSCASPLRPPPPPLLLCPALRLAPAPRSCTPFLHPALRLVLAPCSYAPHCAACTPAAAPGHSLPQSQQDNKTPLRSKRGQTLILDPSPLFSTLLFRLYIRDHDELAEAGSCLRQGHSHWADAPQMSALLPSQLRAETVLNLLQSTLIWSTEITKISETSHLTTASFPVSG